MSSVDPFRHVSVLLLDIVGFTSRYLDVERRAVLERLQDVLTRAAKPFLPEEADIWNVWLRHGVGDGYYVLPSTLSPRQALSYARKVAEELGRSRRRGAGSAEMQLRMVLAFGDVEWVDDQLLSDAFIVAQRFIDDDDFKRYALERGEHVTLGMTEHFHHELEDDPAAVPEDGRFTPVEIRDKHGVAHRGRVEGPGWGTPREAGLNNLGSGLSRHRQSFLEEVFDTLARRPILMLLAQDDYDQGEIIASILERARGSWGEQNTLYITPPYSADAEVGRYFARLGRQCGFKEEIRDALAWDDALDDRLSRGTRLFLVIQGLDNGPATARRDLAGTLRSLLERHGSRLRVVLTGREKLAALKYENGEMSLLNVAEVLTLPELEIADVMSWQLREYPERALTSEEARMILEVSGGHPRLLRFLLLRWERSETKMSRDTCRQALREYGYVREFFMKLGEDVRAEMCEWLQRDDLAPFYLWPEAELLRRLYWANLLLVTKENRLAWRSEAIRETGSEVLKCPP